MPACYFQEIIKIISCKLEFQVSFGMAQQPNLSYNVREHLWYFGIQSEKNKSTHLLKKKGIFYTYGVDRQFRPLVFISFPSDIKKVSTKQLKCFILNYRSLKYQVDDLLAAICILLTTVKKYMFVPGHVENWMILMEASNIGMNTLSNLDVPKQ